MQSFQTRNQRRVSLSFKELLKRVGLNHDFQSLVLLGKHEERSGCSSPLAGWLEHSMVAHLKLPKAGPTESIQFFTFLRFWFWKNNLDSVGGSKFP